MKKTLFTIGILTMIILLYIPTMSNAALQANGKTTKTDELGNWMLNIRLMEEAGGTLGLSDSINRTNLTSNNTGDAANNLDIHMQLNTEYGGLVLLSASAYGKPDKVNNGQTTTGNKSGVYMYFNNEWTAAGAGISKCTQYANANGKYKNVYTTSKSSSKVGDATVETEGWHDSRYEWLDSDYRSGFMRSIKIDGTVSIFSYSGQVAYGCNFVDKANCRAVVVIGPGL